MINGKKYSHTINPKTGYPVTGIKSVSIICTVKDSFALLVGLNCTISDDRALLLPGAAIFWWFGETSEVTE